MQQRWLFNLILLAITLLLSISVFYTMEHDKTTDKANLIDLAVVRSINIQQTEDKHIFMSKNQLGFWEMTAPYQLSVNQVRIERLLNFLSTKDYIALETAKLNLNSVQLAPSLLKIKFNQITVEFGNLSPLNDGKRYILINGKAYLVKETIFNELNNHAINFVNLSVLGNNPQITELKLPNSHLVLRENKWIIKETISDKIDENPNKLTTFIKQWEEAQAFTIEPYAPPAEAIINEVEIFLADREGPIKFEAILVEKLFILAWREKAIQYQLPIKQYDKLLHLPLRIEEKTTIPIKE